MNAVTSITDPDQPAIATIRTLCIHAIQRANSGHPGTPMVMAMASTLFQGFLRIAKARLAASAGG